MASAKFIKAWCLKKVKDMQSMIVNDLSKDIEKTARLHYNRAVKEVPADNPYVVVSRQVSGNSFTISCSGEQVLFIEFGAGITHSTQTSTVLTDSNNKTIEYASRPAGIVPIGMYHYSTHGGVNAYNKFLSSHPNWRGSRGKDDWWIYLSTTGRESKNTTRWGMNRRGEFKMKTSGIRPVRALYLAVGSGIKKITTQKKIRRLG